jgi:hypothetical protein
MISLPDHHLAALREEIRRAGTLTRKSRTFCRVGNWFTLVSLLVLLVPLGLAAMPTLFLKPALLLALVSAPALLGALVARPFAAGVRRLRQKQLLRKLEGLPRHEAAELLLPLQEETGDTGKLAAALIRGLRPLPTELTPASPPAGRGDEASPAG